MLGKSFLFYLGRGRGIQGFVYLILSYLCCVKSPVACSLLGFAIPAVRSRPLLLEIRFAVSHNKIGNKCPTVHLVWFSALRFLAHFVDYCRFYDWSYHADC